MGRLAVAADGTVAVLVQRTLAADGANVTPFSVEELFLHPPGGSWSAPIQVSTPDRAVSGGDLAFDDTGDLTIAWAERYAGGATSSDSDDHYGMKVRVRTASNGVLGVRTDIGGEVWNQSAGSPVLGVNGSGRAVIAWQWGVPSGSSGDYQAWAVTRSAAGGAFSAPVQLVASATSASSGPRAAGVSPDGTAYVAYWRQGMSSADDLFGAERQPLGGSWTAEQGISPSNVDGFDVALAFLGSDALFVYKGTVDYGNPDAYDILQAVRWPAAASTPDAYRDLVSPGTISASDLALNADGSGGAILTWDDYVSGAQHAWAAAFDAAPPVLTSSGVPATATAGSAVTLTAAFADLWSPLSADTPTWDFGDGQTATGATVTHAWAAPGTFTVKVRGRDALGNELSKTYTVQVAAPTTPPGGGPPRDTTPPAVSLTKPRCAKRLSKAACRRHRAARSAWRTLRGTVTDAGGSGVESVEVGVARKQGSRYYVLRGKTFKKGSKAVFQRTFARAVVRGAAWSLRLPGLKPGTYVLRLRATDNAGNVSRVVTVPVRLR